MDSHSDNFEHLKNSAQNNPVVLFLGAGINAKMIPLWPELLRRLLDYALDLRFGSKYNQECLTQLKNALTGSDQPFLKPFLNIYDQANLVKVLLGKQYLSVLRDEIYRDYRKPEAQEKGPTNFLKSIVSLCNCPNVSAVVTYNYDDILLTEIRKSEVRRTYPVWGEKQALKQGSALPIYYIHGYLPNITRVPSPGAAKVVLSPDEYFHNMMEPYSWQTTTQLHFLLNTTCVFLGVSLEDINMLRMLRYSQHYSKREDIYVFMAEESFRQEQIISLLNEMKFAGKSTAADDIERLIIRTKTTLFHDSGVRLVLVPTCDDLPEKVNQLTNCLLDTKKGQ